MPPKPNHDQEFILQGAVTLVKNLGMDALNARALASALGVSTSPILFHFGSMAQLKAVVVERLKADLRTWQEQPRTGEAWLDLLAGFVLYSWKEPRAYEAIRDSLLEGQDGEEARQEVLTAMKQSSTFAGASEEFMNEAFARATIFCYGLGELGRRGKLYNPSELGICDYLIKAVSDLVAGVR